jgi:uracil-DNA glycosylase family 4
MSPEPQICSAQTHRDERFQKIREEYGLASCMITNTVKCGVRDEKLRRHPDNEVTACAGFLIRELDLIRPQVAVGVGDNAYRTLRLHIAPHVRQPRLFKITHYAARRNVFKAWEQEFPELLRLLDG